MKYTCLALVFLYSCLLQPAHAAEDTDSSRAQEFKQVDLAQALEVANERNPSLQAARTDIEKAQAKLKSSWAILLPVATGTLTFTHNDHHDSVALGGGPEVIIRRQDDLRGNLMVTMPVINARAWLGVWAARQGEKVSELSVENVRQTLLLTVAQTYFAALSARSLIEISKNNIAAIERHQAVARLRYSHGTGKRVDVLRAETELIAAKESLISAQNAFDNSCDALGTLMGYKTMVRPKQAQSMTPPSDSLSELEAKALDQREDIKLQRAMTEMAERQLTSSWMSFIPSLGLSWQLNQQLTDPSDFSDADKSRWFYALTLSVPIYDHTRYAELDQLRAAVHRAELDKDNAELQASLEVRQAYRQWKKTQVLVDSARQKAKVAMESLKLAELAYASGSGSSLEVTDARRTSQQAQMDLAVRELDFQLGLLELFRKTGTDMMSLLEKGD